MATNSTEEEEMQSCLPKDSKHESKKKKEKNGKEPDALQQQKVEDTGQFTSLPLSILCWSNTVHHSKSLSSETNNHKVQLGQGRKVLIHGRRLLVPNPKKLNHISVAFLLNF